MGPIGHDYFWLLIQLNGKCGCLKKIKGINIWHLLIAFIDFKFYNMVYKNATAVKHDTYIKICVNNTIFMTLDT